MTKEKTKKPLKTTKHKENPKKKAAKELTPEMIAQGLRKWLMEDKKK